MSENNGFMLQDGIAQRHFALTGKVEKPDPRRVPMRGDLAHIGLAGKYFVPHYAEPLQRMVSDCGANLRAEPNEDSEIIHDLSPGGRFDQLDSAGGWAWGCLGIDGPVGYVRLDELLDPYS